MPPDVGSIVRYQLNKAVPSGRQWRFWQVPKRLDTHGKVSAIHNLGDARVFQPQNRKGALMTTYPLKEVSVADGKHLELTGFISLKGRCTDKPDTNLADPSLTIQLELNGCAMESGLSAQQKKVGIGVVQQMFVRALKFFGQEPVSDLLPGTFVRVLLPTAKELERYRYIGVVDSIDGDILVLLTYDEDGELHDVRIPHKQFVIERINGYTGVADFPRFLIDHHSSTLLPLNLQVAHATLTKRKMQADGMMEPDPDDSEEEVIVGDIEDEDENGDVFDLSGLLDGEEDALTFKEVHDALRIAAAQHAHEIRFMPIEGRKALLVDIRQNMGRFTSICEHPLSLGSAIILRLKIMAKIPLDGAYEFDEGFIENLELNGVKRRLHVSTCWARGGEMALVQFIDGVVHRPCDNANPETVFAPSEIEALIAGARGDSVSDFDRRVDERDLKQRVAGTRSLRAIVEMLCVRQEIIALIPAAVAREYRVIPIRKDKDGIIVAADREMSDTFFVIMQRHHNIQVTGISWVPTQALNEALDLYYPA